ncbi:polysaccharide lyase [Marinobacter pelagius]|uniref:polysaccharide lyase n=1 Tax=Marinobacter sp. C7 TaxID=2951363 RepID=UPI001EF0F274|nr:polysaccharide lyase [Marinobacter sp. C7]MCG7199471.1 polysaccharide lyase [Marinobacter sp. C7]
MKPSKIILGALGLSFLASISTPSFAWTRNLTFEDGRVGSQAQGTASDFDGASGGSYITDERVLRGSKAAKLTVTGGSTAYGEWGGVIDFPRKLGKGDEIWFSVNTFFPDGFNYDSSGEGSHLKFLRVHVNNSGGSNVGYNDWYINPEASSIPHKFIFEGQQQWFTYGAPSDEPQRGTWESYEMYIKFDDVPVDSGGNAIVRVWKNGQLLREITGAKTLRNASDLSDRAHLFTYWNGGAPKTQHMYVDDIVLTSDTPPYRDAQGNPMATQVGDVSAPAAPDLSIE